MVPAVAVDVRVQCASKRQAFSCFLNKQVDGLERHTGGGYGDGTGDGA